MPKPRSHVPEGLAPVIPQLVVKGAAGYIDFLRSAFDAKTQMPPMMSPDGKSVMHAVMTIEGHPVFLGDPMGSMPPLRCGLAIYVTDCDAVVERARKAGAKVLEAPAVQPWGDRWALLEDPAGNQWQVATHVEDVEPAEIARRMEKMMRG